MKICDKAAATFKIMHTMSLYMTIPFFSLNIITYLGFNAVYTGYKKY